MNKGGSKRYGKQRGAKERHACALIQLADDEPRALYARHHPPCAPRVDARGGWKKRQAYANAIIYHLHIVDD